MLWTLLIGLAAAEDGWITRDVSMLRWPDHAEGQEIVVADALAGDKIEVLFREAELVRVRRGGDFGWVATDAVTTEDPAAAVE